MIADSHRPILGSRRFAWPDEAVCAAWAAQLALQPALHNLFIALHGTLGAGKTTFVRHLLRALGVQGRIKSPTYAVLESYEVPSNSLQGRNARDDEGLNLAISHFDFYRFNDPREWLDAGFRELFAAPGLKLAEWPEHVAGVLPVADVDLFIEPGAADPSQPDRRDVRADAGTAAGLQLIMALG